MFHSCLHSEDEDWLSGLDSQDSILPLCWPLSLSDSESSWFSEPTMLFPGFCSHYSLSLSHLPITWLPSTKSWHKLHCPASSPWAPRRVMWLLPAFCQLPQWSWSSDHTGSIMTAYLLRVPARLWALEQKHLGLTCWQLYLPIIQ